MPRKTVRKTKPKLGLGKLASGNAKRLVRGRHRSFVPRPAGSTAPRTEVATTQGSRISATAKRRNAYRKAAKPVRGRKKR